MLLCGDQLSGGSWGRLVWCLHTAVSTLPGDPAVRILYTTHTTYQEWAGKMAALWQVTLDWLRSWTVIDGWPVFRDLPFHWNSPQDRRVTCVMSAWLIPSWQYGWWSGIRDGSVIRWVDGGSIWSSMLSCRVWTGCCHGQYWDYHSLAPVKSSGATGRLTLIRHHPWDELMKPVNNVNSVHIHSCQSPPYFIRPSECHFYHFLQPKTFKCLYPCQSSFFFYYYLTLISFCLRWHPHDSN